jgi:predicted lipoprotein with Yx(FWY)xxD motif
MTRLVLTLIACAALVTGCGSDDSEESSADQSPAGGETTERVAEKDGAGRQQAGRQQTEQGSAEPEPAEAEPAAKPRSGPLVELRDSQFGPVLFDGKDRALYLFTRDPRNQTRCYGACAQAWPPFYAKGRPRAGRGVDRSLLGTIERRDGRRQVTYNGQALYFYVDDPKGQVLCNDVVEFGGTWYAVDAEGNPPA